MEHLIREKPSGLCRKLHTKLDYWSNSNFLFHVVSYKTNNLNDPFPILWSQRQKSAAIRLYFELGM